MFLGQDAGVAAVVQQRGKETAGKWAILQMAGPRTLLVVRALNDAGIEAWTPTEKHNRRRHRASKATVEVQVPIMPTFAFVRAEYRDTLRAALAMPICPFPAFSFFSRNGDIPLIDDRSIQALRDHEQRKALEWKRTNLKDERPIYEVGSRVRTDEGGFAGMIGIVEGDNGKAAIVSFGGWMTIEIDSWLLRSDRVLAEPATTGTAALAA